MPYAITQTCCADASCVAVCPVNCIHPTPDEGGFGSTDMLYVDPRTCISCGACTDACPVDAIHPVEDLRGPERFYAQVNAEYFAAEPADTAPPAPTFHTWSPPTFTRSVPSDSGKLQVAVVGTGPAGMYAAEDLLLHTNARVTLIDRLPVSGGLMRYGVAPDHPSTRRIIERFSRFHRHPRVRTRLGVEVGRDVSHDELAARYDAVIYAVGAGGERRLGVPGEELAGSLSARTFVGWYNGHPEIAPDAVELPAGRVAVVGTGNVALDVARILVSDPEALAGTEMAAHAVAALKGFADREVVLIGRRGPAEAAYTVPELLALTSLPGVELVVDDHDPAIRAAVESAGGFMDRAAALRGVEFRRMDYSGPPRPGRRVVLRFGTSPVELRGGQRVEELVTSTGPVQTGLVLRAVGYRGTPVPGLPFDEQTGTVPHVSGRVIGRRGTYVVGWIKRGPTGGIGTNRRCAAETVGTLLADAGQLVLDHSS